MVRPIALNDLFGGVLASGDFNDDGFDDLAVGTPYEDLGGNNQLTNAGLLKSLTGRIKALRLLRNAYISTVPACNPRLKLAISSCRTNIRN